MLIEQHIDMYLHWKFQTILKIHVLSMVCSDVHRYILMHVLYFSETKLMIYNQNAITLLQKGHNTRISNDAIVTNWKSPKLTEKI